MIVTILSGSSSFHGVEYNQRKVSSGDAAVMEMQNMGWVENTDATTVDIVNYFKDYSSRNPNVKKAQFHIAVSCQGKEMTHEELLEFGKEYLKEMGYGEDGQPFMAYAHYDTDNNHVHIVTSRVAPDGHKIDHNHERIRSQQVIEKLEKRDVALQIEKDLKKAFEYTFSSATEFSAIMGSMGYKAFRNNDKREYSFKKGSSQWKTISIDSIEARCGRANSDPKERRRLRAMLFKYRDISSDKEELRSTLHKKLGIDIQFFGKEESPYGYILIDHKNKKVFKGSSIMKLPDLLQFKTPEQHLETVDGFIDRVVTANPDMTTRELNSKLRKYGVVVRKGKIHTRKVERELKPFVKSVLKQNDKISFVCEFKPATAVEVEALARVFKVDKERIPLCAAEKNGFIKDRFEYIEEVVCSSDANNIKMNVKNAGAYIYRNDSEYVIVDLLNKKTVVLDRDNQSHRRLAGHLDNINSNERKQNPTKQERQDNGRSMPDKVHVEKPKRGDNREWEIDKNLGMDEVDNGRSIRVD